MKMLLLLNYIYHMGSLAANIYVFGFYYTVLSKYTIWQHIDIFTAIAVKASSFHSRSSSWVLGLQL